MSLEQKIEADWKAAFKAGDHAVKSTLSLVRAEITNWKKASQANAIPSDDQVQTVLAKMKKQLADALEESKTRPDTVLKLNKEISIIASYLPTQITDEQIEAEVKQVMQIAASKDFSAVMKLASAKLKGKADGKKVSEVVRRLTSN